MDWKALTRRIEGGELLKEDHAQDDGRGKGRRYVAFPRSDGEKAWNIASARHILTSSYLPFFPPFPQDIPNPRPLTTASSHLKWQTTDTPPHQKCATRELAASSVKSPSTSSQEAARRRRRCRHCRRSSPASPLDASWCQRPARSGRGPCPQLRPRAGSPHRRTGPQPRCPWAPPPGGREAATPPLRCSRTGAQTRRRTRRRSGVGWTG